MSGDPETRILAGGRALYAAALEVALDLGEDPALFAFAALTQALAHATLDLIGYATGPQRRADGLALASEGLIDATTELLAAADHLRRRTGTDPIN